MKLAELLKAALAVLQLILPHLRNDDFERAILQSIKDSGVRGITAKEIQEITRASYTGIQIVIRRNKDRIISTKGKRQTRYSMRSWWHLLPGA